MRTFTEPVPVLDVLRPQVVGITVPDEPSSSRTRSLARVFSRLDGGVSITVPAWNDGLSPFGKRFGVVRQWYAYAPMIAIETLRREGIRLLPELIDLRTEALRENLRYTFAPWIALFPFDPLTVTEEDFYKWCVRNPTGLALWEPGTTIRVKDAQGRPLSVQRVVGHRFYEAVTEGCTGQLEPVHESGEATDGGVVWRYIGTGKLWGDCDRASIPQSREFRNQWRVNETLGVHVDPVLEYDERWRRLLAERDLLLQESDKSLMLAIETGEGLEQVKTYRKALRSITPALGDPQAVTLPSPHGGHNDKVLSISNA